MVLIPFQEEIGKSVKRSAVVVGIAALNPTHYRRSSRDVDHAEEVCFETPGDVRGRLSWFNDAITLTVGHLESDPADHKVVRREKGCLVPTFVLGLPVTSIALRSETERPSHHPRKCRRKRVAERGGQPRPDAGQPTTPPRPMQRFLVCGVEPSQHLWKQVGAIVVGSHSMREQHKQSRIVIDEGEVVGECLVETLVHVVDGIAHSRPTSCVEARMSTIVEMPQLVTYCM